MQALSAVAVARMLMMNSNGVTAVEGEDIALGSLSWYIYAGISCLLVLFAGIMSGLTLGLMSLGLVELEILHRSGTPTEKKQAAHILPVVQKQHQLLVTLLLCNAAAMEALPIFLDKIFHPIVAVILSVTFVLVFGEVIPQAICTRYGLAVGSNFVWLIRILMVVCYPISYPIGKPPSRLKTQNPPSPSLLSLRLSYCCCRLQQLLLWTDPADSDSLQSSTSRHLPITILPSAALHS